MKDSINAGDIRKGNYLRHIVHGIIQVQGVWAEPVKDGNLEQVRHNGEWHLLGHCAPIPLSKEVLEKIPEFREDNYGLWILYSEYSASVHKPLLWIKWVNAEGGGYWDVCAGEALDKLSNVNRIQNLHELQNIAFAFGYELEITL